MPLDPTVSWTDYFQGLRTPPQPVPIVGTVLPNPKKGGNAPGDGIKLEDGAWVYSVGIVSSTTQKPLRIDGVRETVPAFYGDGAGRRYAGERVLLQKRSRTLWEIIGSEPQVYEGDAPGSFIRAGVNAYIWVDPAGVSVTNGERQVRVTPDAVIVGTGNDNQVQLRFTGAQVIVVPNSGDAGNAQVVLYDSHATSSIRTGAAAGHSHTVNLPLKRSNILRASGSAAGDL